MEAEPGGRRKRNVPNGRMESTPLLPNTSLGPQLPAVRKRTKRPGQVLPHHAAASPAVAAQPSPDYDSDEQPSHRPSSAQPAARGPAWQERKEREGDAWDALIEPLKEEMIVHAALHARYRSDECLERLLRLRQRARAGWQLHKCCHLPGGGASDACLDPRPSRMVTYRHLTCQGQLEVPKYFCRACETTFSPTALQLGCFQSTPVEAEVFYDLYVQEMYMHMGTTLGVSGGGFCGTIDRLYALSEASVPLVRPSQFEGSAFAFSRAASALDDLVHLGVPVDDPDDPFRLCFICSSSSDVKGDLPGGPSLEWWPSAAADAMQKAGHFRQAGCSGCREKARRRHFFGAADAVVERRFEDNQLSLAARQLHGTGGANDSDCSSSSSSTSTSDSDDDSVPAPVCGTVLKCGRPSSRAKGVCDVHGLVGAVCAHTVPICGTFVDMRTPEQFAYYIIMLAWLVVHAPQLRDVYIDFGCRFAKTWQQYLQKHADVPGSKLRIMVNWMHAKGHVESCEVVNSARHQLGAARRVGENTEQLWSMLKNLGGLVRYMTLAHRRDFIETALLQIARRKLLGIVPLMARRFKDITSKKVSTREELDRIAAAALLDGVEDMSVAQQLFLRHAAGTDSADPISWQVKMVSLLMTRTGMTEAATGGKVYALLSPTVVASLAKLSCADKLAKITAQLVQLEKAHNIGPGRDARWKPTMAPYQAALQELKLLEVARCRRDVVGVVLDIKQAFTDRKRSGPADKDGKALLVTSAHLNHKLEDRLLQLYTWMCIDGLQTVQDVGYSQAQVKAMKLSVSVWPWADDGASVVAAHHVRHGRLHHSAQSDVDRTWEGEAEIRIEKLRLIKGLTVALRQVQLAINAQGLVACARDNSGCRLGEDGGSSSSSSRQDGVPPSRAAGVGGTAASHEGPSREGAALGTHGDVRSAEVATCAIALHAHDGLAAGKVFMLMTWQRRLQALLHDANTLLVGIAAP